jgi:hypothetical protein
LTGCLSRSDGIWLYEGLVSRLTLRSVPATFFWQKELFMQTLVGTWKLIEARAFDEAGNEMPSPLGPTPMGFVLFEAERMIGAVADGRPAMPPDAPQRAFFSYTGRYEFDGETLVTRVDGASSPDGFADQVRRITFQGSDRIVVVPLSRVLDRSSGLELIWERVG